MDIDVLGGLHVLENGVPIAPAAPPARQVLALLAAQADQVVPVAVLAEELAAHVPPEHAHSVLHSCVRELRERLAASVAPGGDRTAETVLVQTPGGYLLDTGGGRSDLRDFVREAGAGYRAMARGDHETAARRLRGALRLWKGPAFDGVSHGPRLTERIADLEATRKAVAEQWVEAELALGHHRELRTGLAELSLVPGLATVSRQPSPAAAADDGAGSDSGWGPSRDSGWGPRTVRPERSLADVLGTEFGRGSAELTSALRRSLLRGAPSMA